MGFQYSCFDGSTRDNGIEREKKPGKPAGKQSPWDKFVVGIALVPASGSIQRVPAAAQYSRAGKWGPERGRTAALHAKGL